MLEAGEDARFIARRMIIFASEGRGHGRSAGPAGRRGRGPRARARRPAGGQLNLSQAAIHLATAPKSNRSALAIWNAASDVQNGAVGEVPPHLRDAHYKGARSLGHGVGYDYPHDIRRAGSNSSTCPTTSATSSTTNRASTEQRRRGKANGRTKMTRGELAVVLAAVLCCIGFAALIVVLVRVLDTMRDCAAKSCRLRQETGRCWRVADVDRRCQARWQEARDDLERFDRVLGSAEAISGALSGGSRVARARSAPGHQDGGAGHGHDRGRCAVCGARNGDRHDQANDLVRRRRRRRRRRRHALPSAR
jgi:hypothetical protein